MILKAGGTRASALAKITAALTLAYILCLVMPALASAAASYAFEPTLSLTGNCATSPKLDPVPDPGLCPIPPGVPGKDHPSTRFEAPSVTVDRYGDIYVASMLEAKSRIDVFAPDGTFVTEFKDEVGPQSIAVDSEGNVYVFERLSGGERQIRRFPPKVYEPEKDKIEYGEAPVKVVGNETEPLLLGFGQLAPESTIAIDPSTDQLYVDYSQKVARFDSAKKENKLLEKEAITGLKQSQSIAIDAGHGKIYLSDQRLPSSIVRVFQLGAPHEEVGEITGSTTPKGQFLSPEGNLQLDVDEKTGHVFVGDIVVASKVYEFEEDGTYLATIEHSFEAAVGPGGVVGELAVDNGPKSPHRSWLFVPSVPSPSAGHVYAFEPNEEGPPIVESTSAGDITETEATLHATINPGGLETTYRFEYVTQQQFEAEEGNSFKEGQATLAGEGALPKGSEGTAVSAPATGLEPGSKYRFRVFARNENAKEEVGEDEKQGTFKTFEEGVSSSSCGNESLRTGSSVLLPDCRAYELVTPPDTNGRPPSGTGYAGVYFPTLEASRDGNSASFYIEGGLVPGQEGTGSFNGDLYHATRGGEGWASEVAGPNGEEAVTSNPGGVSPDQAFSFWEDFQNATIYIHFPDGHSELVGQGSLGDVSKVEAKLITDGGKHIVFVSTAHLEPNAAPEGTKTIYDRSAEGPTHVVSLLPGDEPQESGEHAEYLGASEDGEGIAFKINGTIYLRLHAAETFEVAGPGSTFAGVADEGKRVFYLEGGDLFAFDAEEPAEPIQFSSSGDATPVNVAEDGTRAYFVSPSELTKVANPNGEVAEKGAENLYLSEEGAISFVGVVTKRDVEGETSPAAGQIGGLGLWTSAFLHPAADPSRTTPTGTTLLFESRADLTEFDSEGFAQVYRYDSTDDRLDCLSCSPADASPASDASLQGIAQEIGAIVPASYWARIPNQSPDGKRAFFQTAEPLVVGDTDKKLDVYEWEESGVGSCEKPGGCVYLISGGHSSSADYLYAMSASGNDVFFRTADQLLPRDVESTLSIYDARVGGGFPEPKEPPPCEGEACHPLGSTPQLAPPTTSVEGPSDSPPSQGKKCPKGKRRVTRHGKPVCVKKGHKKKQKHHRKASPSKKGGSK